MEGKVNTEYLDKCLKTLQKSYEMINQAKTNTVEYEMYRNSLVKSFEMTLEQCSKLLKKKILPFFSSKREVDKLTFKDVFRHAFKHSLIDEPAVVRWMKYRDNRNNTAHDYGQKFADETLSLIESFISDAQKLKAIIEND